MFSSTLILSIYKDFAATSYGQKLGQSIRYERYNLAHLPHTEWQRLLGPDVNNLEHMFVAYQLAERLIIQEDLGLTDEEQTLLLLAAIVHDQAESLTGDITYGDKTADDTASEQELFRNHMAEFMPHASPETQALISKAVDQVIFDEHSQLGSIFNVVERIGYTETALRAYNVKQNDNSLDEQTRLGLTWLTGDVLHNQITALTTQPFAHAFLRNNPLITDAFEDTPDDIFPLYGEKEAQKRELFTEAKQAWDAWTKAEH